MDNRNYEFLHDRLISKLAFVCRSNYILTLLLWFSIIILKTNYSSNIFLFNMHEFVRFWNYLTIKTYDKKTEDHICQNAYLNIYNELSVHYKLITAGSSQDLPPCASSAPESLLWSSQARLTLYHVQPQKAPSCYSSGLHGISPRQHHQQKNRHGSPSGSWREG